MPITQLHPGAIAGKRYGSFAGKNPTPPTPAPSFARGGGGSGPYHFIGKPNRPESQVEKNLKELRDYHERERQKEEERLRPKKREEEPQPKQPKKRHVKNLQLADIDEDLALIDSLRRD